MCGLLSNRTELRQYLSMIKLYPSIFYTIRGPFCLKLNINQPWSVLAVCELNWPRNGCIFSGSNIHKFDYFGKQEPASWNYGYSVVISEPCWWLHGISSYSYWAETYLCYRELRIMIEIRFKHHQNLLNKRKLLKHFSFSLLYHWLHRGIWLLIYDPSS